HRRGNARRRNGRVPRRRGEGLGAGVLARLRALGAASGSKVGERDMPKVRRRDAAAVKVPVAAKKKPASKPPATSPRNRDEVKITAFAAKAIKSAVKGPYELVP